MGKLPKLVSALAECDERERATLDHIARVIRDAGGIPTTKRGSGAADMTFREAATLLIGASVAESSPKLAALAVVHYRSLIGQDYSPLDYTEDPPGTFTGTSRTQEGVFAKITNAANFGEALEALIEGAPELCISLMHYMDDAYSNQNEQVRRTMKAGMLAYGDFARVEVIFHRPVPFAVIRIVTLPAGNERVQYEWRFNVDADLLMQGAYHVKKGDARSTRTIGLKTLLNLFAAVTGDEESSSSSDEAVQS